MSGIVGRDAEIEAGDAFLAAARDGRAALVIEGEAGIGKTTVWAAIVERAAEAGVRVLVSRPAAAEAPLTLSALADLLEPLPPEVLDALPPPQRRALATALLREEPGEGPLEERLLATAIRSALERLADRGPLLLALDDLQWADPATARCLAYALRRIHAAPIGVLAARRSGLSLPLEVGDLAAGTTVRHLTVGPITVAALHHVLKGRLGAVPGRSTLVRIHEAADGNPLLALEIAAALADAGASAGSGPLPVPTDVRTLVQQRLGRLDQGARDVLLAAAAMGRPETPTLQQIVGRDVAGDLAAAEREGVVRVAEGTVAFVHPLFAAGVYGLSDAPARRGVHGRIAEVARSPEERARHRALAADGPDESLASELEEAARLADRRGAPAAAAGLAEMALERTPPDATDARLLRAIALGGFLQRAGDATRARAVFDRVIAEAPPGLIRARAEIAAAILAFETDLGPVAAGLAEDAVIDAEGDVVLLAYAHAVGARVGYDDRITASGHAQEAHRLLETIPDPDPMIAQLVLGAYIGAEADAGRPLPSEAISRALALEQVAPLPNVGDRVSASLGPILRVREDFDGARRWLEATYRAAVEEGDEGSVPYALSHLPTLELAIGDWTRAAETAAWHMDAAVRTELAAQRAQALFNVGIVHVQLGNEQEAREALGELAAIAQTSGSGWDLSVALGALGALALARDDTAEAAALLLRSSALRDEVGERIPRRHDADAVESLVAAGNLQQAAAIAAAAEERASAAGLHSALAVAHRAAAVVAGARGDLEAADRRIQAALREHEVAPVPYERARTRLAQGRLLRRARRRTEAKAAFEAALAEFERLGARLWVERTRGELERTGIRRATRHALTGGERRVAELAATGMTNREVAAALFVSPKTVESTLAKAYAKLGVRSRAELGALLGPAGSGGTPAGDDGDRPGVGGLQT